VRRDVLLLDGAEQDLKDIIGYIARQDGAARAAAILTALEETCDRLDEFAERGNIPKELAALGIGEFREAHYKPYRIVYRIVGSRVIVYAVLDGRRDMQTLLRRRLRASPLSPAGPVRPGPRRGRS